MSQLANDSQSPLIPTWTSPDWNNIDALEIINARLANATQLLLDTTAGTLRLELSDIGVRIRSQSERDFDYDILSEQPVAKPLDLELNEDHCVVSDQALRLTIGFKPFTYELRSKAGELLSQSPTDGHFVRRHRVPPLAKLDDAWVFSADLKSSEAIYGLGEKWGGLNKRGQLIRSYNSDALGVNAEISYKNTPFIWSPEGWGIFSHTRVSLLTL